MVRSELNIQFLVVWIIHTGLLLIRKIRSLYILPKRPRFLKYDYTPKTLRIKLSIFLREAIILVVPLVLARTGGCMFLSVPVATFATNRTNTELLFGR